MSKLSFQSLIFVRHGHTDWRKSDLSKGPQDLPLNGEGRKCVKITGEKIKAMNFCSDSKIIASTLLRAKETAEIISEVASIPVTSYHENLQERYYGDFQLVSDLSQIPPDAETTKQFKDRVISCLRGIIRDEGDHPLVIVAHQKVFECICRYLTGKKKQLAHGEMYLFQNSNDQK